MGGGGRKSNIPKNYNGDRTKMPSRISLALSNYVVYCNTAKVGKLKVHVLQLLNV